VAGTAEVVDVADIGMYGVYLTVRIPLHDTGPMTAPRRRARPRAQAIARVC
jgi:hypothetical protein